MSNELQNFEDDMNHLIANLEFREINSPFQKRMKDDIRKIQTSKNILLPRNTTGIATRLEKGLVLGQFQVDETKPSKRSTVA